MKSMSIWQENKAGIINYENIEKLFSNEIGALVIKDFALKNECLSFVNVVKKIGFDNYIGVNPPIGRIGITQFESKEHSKEWYFNHAQKSRKTQEKIFSLSFNPLERMKSIFEKQLMKLFVAQESNKKDEYFCGLVRQINNSALIHADYAPHDAPDWAIGKIKSQIAWNLCLEAPSVGGECIIYNKPWHIEDEKYRIKNSYGYQREIVKNAKSIQISPKVGDCYFFNCRNFHEVNNTEGGRITISCFLGLSENNEIMIWS